MYFLLAGVLTRLRFLTVGLAFVLAFIGGKMIAHKWVDLPEYISLLIVIGISGDSRLPPRCFFPVRGRAS